MKYKTVSFLFFWAFSTTLLAQTDSTETIAPAITDGLEELFQREEGDGAFELTDQLDLLAELQRRPLNLNETTQEELEVLPFLSALQTANIVKYRSDFGPFLAIYELQAVPGLDLTTIRKMQPYIEVKGDNFKNTTVRERRAKIEHQLLLRTQQEWPRSRGFRDALYPGSPQGVFLRYRLKWNNWQFGITGDKDPGEQFGRGINPNGFDFYSAHLFWQGQNKYVKTLALGDYRVAMGQGLLFQGGGLVQGKGSGAVNVRRGSKMLQPYTSANEAAGLRGVAVVLQPQKNVELLLFGSSKRRDANITINQDTLDNGEEGILAFSSLLGGGLHRTNAEALDKQVLRHTIVGASAKYKLETGHVALSGLQHQFDKTLSRTDAPYNALAFENSKLLNIGADYSYRWRNIMLFGEAAKGDKKAIAFTQGLLAGLNRRVDFALMYRNLPPNYHAIEAQPFAEGSNGNNERGLYMGTEIRASRSFNFQAYFDTWQRPWLQYTTSMPSYGNEYFLKSLFIIKRKLEVYVQYRYKTNEINLSSTVLDVPLRPIVVQNRAQWRLHVQHNATRALTLRMRAEATRFEREGSPNTFGYLMYQDFILKPAGSKFSGNTRICLFQTDDFNSRVYAYENNVAYFYRIPALSGRGVRTYINFKYKPLRRLTLEANYGQTLYQDKTEIGSGYDEIQGNKNQEFVFQIRWSAD